MFEGSLRFPFFAASEVGCNNPFYVKSGGRQLQKDRPLHRAKIP